MQISHDELQNAKNALIFIEYEGVLSSLSTQPTQPLLETLEKLSKKVNLMIVSNQTKNVVHDWFKSVKSMGLAAEHGFFYRLKT